MDEKNKKSIDKRNILIDKQIVLIDKQIKAVPRTLTNDEMQILLLQREQLVESKQLDNYKKESNAEPAKEKERPSLAKRALKGVARSALGDDQGQAAAAAEIIGDVGKKVFGKLFRKKKDDENPEDGKEPTSEGAPERAESSKKPTTDNEAIISILNKILGSFQADNERMRRSKRDEAESKLEGDPTPDAGSPEKAEEKKDSGMGKLLMFGAIAGLIGTAIAFKDDISKMLDPIKSMLGIKDPTVEDADKDDFNFDIGEMIGLAGLLSFLGIPTITPDVKPKPKPKPIVKPGAGAGAGGTGGTGGGGPGTLEKAGPGNARPRHPAGAINAAGKKIGGQFMKVDPETIKDVVKKSIEKRAGGALGKVLPGLGLAFGLYDAFTRAKDGDLTGAGIALTGGVVGLAPGLGTGASIALIATNIARDVYNDAYGVYPEADESGEKAKRAEEILKEVVKALSPQSPDKPMSGEQRDALTQELTAYSDQIKAERAGGLSNPQFRQRLASNLHKKAQALDIDKETVDTELNVLRAAGAPERDIEANKQLQALTASNAAANAEAAAGGGAASDPTGLGAAAASGERLGGTDAGTPTASGADPTAAGGSMGGGGTPEAAAPAPVSATSGSAVTAATMNANEAQNTVTVLPPEISNETRNMRSGNEDTGKKQKIKMQVRLNDDVFHSAIASTAASRGSLPSVFT